MLNNSKIAYVKNILRRVKNFAEWRNPEHTQYSLHIKIPSNMLLIRSLCFLTLFELLDLIHYTLQGKI